jgi:hypothetical protein
VLQHLSKEASTQFGILNVFAVEINLQVEAPDIPERWRRATKSGAEKSDPTSI